MEYVVSILVMAAVITAWGYCFSKWKRHSGGCGNCAALRTDRTPGGGSCGQATECEPHPPTETDDPQS